MSRPGSGVACTASSGDGLALSPLGKPAAYVQQYDALLLHPLQRLGKRQEIGVLSALPFVGADLWTAYELSWLNPRGKPQVALAQFTVPCESPCIIESKSLKLYLASFSGTRIGDVAELRDTLRRDLTEATWRGADAQQVRSVGVSLIGPDRFDEQRIAALPGLSLDRLDIDCDTYTPAPHFLTAAFGEAPVEETLHSHLLKSNCLVTGQPDWGSVVVRYAGPPIDQAGLLRYIVSFRDHNEFHEQCVERMFVDIQRACRPLKLQVWARYTRRGGIDINPWRSSHPDAPPSLARTARQ